MEFTITGSYVKWFHTKIPSNSTSYQPWGVCVSKTGIVGVGTRQGTTSNGGTVNGNVEFWNYNAASGSTPTGYGSGMFGSDEFCAFDKKSNFFVDGAALSGLGGGQQIGYIAANHINTPAATLCNSALGNANYWVGMYPRIDSPVDQTLSVGAAVGSSTSESVYNWTVTGASNCSLAFVSAPTYTFTTYPSTIDPMYQLAPSKNGALGKLFIADYGAGQTLEGPANGGAIATYETVPSTTGVATQPSGQY